MSALSVIAAAQPIEAPAGMSSCDHPFTNARLTASAYPDYPLGYGEVSTDVEVEVAIGPDGSLDDAWILVFSGIKAFDDEALRVARASKYAAGTALCVPAPGRYRYVLSFK